MKYALFLKALVLLAAGFGIFWLSAGAGRYAKPEVSSRKRVRVAAVETGNVSREIRFSGVLRAAKRAELSFTVAGRMETRPVEIGSRVEAGQLIALLDEQPGGCRAGDEAGQVEDGDALEPAFVGHLDHPSR